MLYCPLKGPCTRRPIAGRGIRGLVVQKLRLNKLAVSPYSIIIKKAKGTSIVMSRTKGFIALQIRLFAL